MDSRCKYISYEPVSGTLIMQVGRLQPETLEALEKMRDKDLDLSLKVHREKRSIEANSYFHVLVNKIAEVLHTSNVEVKNKLIRDYGQYEYIDGVIPTYLVKPEFVESMLNNPAIHFTQVGYEGDRVKLAVMRGSHTYDSKSMSTLINGTVQEAKELGIETMTPSEIAKMIKDYEARYGERKV